MKKYFIYFSLMLFFSNSSSQTTISGFVEDSESGEKLIGANILAKKSQKGSISDEYGFFSLTLNDKDSIRISYIGYEAISYFFDNLLDIKVVFTLKPNTTFDEVVVKGALKRSTLNQLSISINKLIKIPTLGGERDLMKSLSLLPGISTGKEGSSNLHIRGGSPDQNMFLVDGVPVYNATHLGGYLSVFNPNAVKDIDLYKGYFPARFGGRLSSVIDVKMKEGNNKKRKVKLGLGVLTSHVLLEGPIKKEKSSFLFTGRYSYLGLVNLMTKKKSNGYYFNYWLYDLNGKINIPVKKGRLFLSTYWGNDNGINTSNYSYNQNDTVIAKTKTKNLVSWGNKTLALRYSLPLSSKVFTQLQLGWANYKYNFYFEKERQDYLLDEYTYFEETSTSSFNDFLFNYKLNYYPNSKHSIRIGLDLTKKDNTINIDNEDILKNYSSSAIESALFIEDEFQISKSLSVNAGLRGISFRTLSKNKFFLEPRLEIKYSTKENLKISTSIGENHQNIHLISQNGFGLPNDIWVLATDEYPAQSIVQQSFNIEYSIYDLHLLNLGFYLGNMNNLINYSIPYENKDEIHLVDWSNNIQKNGIGRTKGIELLYTFENRRINIISGYTLSFSERKFEQLNNNKWYPYDFERKHDVSLNVQYKLTKKWSFSSNYIYHTGRPITLPVSRFTLPQGANDTYSFGSKNNGNFPFYQRVDVGVSYKITNKWKDIILFNFSIYNVLNRNNPNYFIFNNKAILDKNSQFKYLNYSIKQISLFSLIPALSIEYEFK